MVYPYLNYIYCHKVNKKCKSELNVLKIISKILTGCIFFCKTLYVSYLISSNSFYSLKPTMRPRKLWNIKTKVKLYYCLHLDSSVKEIFVIVK